VGLCCETTFATRYFIISVIVEELEGPWSRVVQRPDRERAVLG